MQKQSLLKRKPKSDVASKFVGVLSKDKKGRPQTLVVPGSDGKQYHVILRRYQFDYPTITTECRLCVGYHNHEDCKGNSYKNLCYHSRAAVDFAVEHKWDKKKEQWVDSNLRASWCVNLDDAKLRNRISKGQIFRVRSRQSNAEAFIVVNKKVEQLRLAL